MKENEVQLQKLLDCFLKKFDPLPVIKNSSVEIKSVEDLSRLNENQYHLFINEVLLKLELHKGEENEYRRISESYITEV